MSGCATIPFVLIPFGMTDAVPLQGTLELLFNFCFFVPQQPEAIVHTWDYFTLTLNNKR